MPNYFLYKDSGILGSPNKSTQHIDVDVDAINIAIAQIIRESCFLKFNFFIIRVPPLFLFSKARNILCNNLNIPQNYRFFL